MMTVRRMTEAETAPRMTNRDGETEERRTDLVGSASASRAESGSEIRGQYKCNKKFDQILAGSADNIPIKESIFY